MYDGFFMPFPLIFHTSCALEVRHRRESARIVKIRFILFFYVFKYVIEDSEPADVLYRSKDEHDQYKD